ncbi:nucleotidyl transferase AbiEii/AbiGii toxin family protein [Deltaproteobacteria bacterium TL4]
MSADIVQNELKRYAPKSIQEEEMAIREISQELILSGLERAGFFRVAEFQGGTCLRIFHGLQRFSEDLDFALSVPDPEFKWSPYLKRLEEEVKVYGYRIQVNDRSKVEQSIKQVFIKENSIGNILKLEYPSIANRPIRIKLEVDINPPIGALTETLFLNFPTISSVTVQNAQTLFSGKIHALLCRKWEKGRDWYDFLWYLNRKTEVNWNLLSQALKQMGPWAKQEVKVNKQWLEIQLEKRISEIDLEIAKEDIIRFLKPHEIQSLHYWNKEFFLHALEKWSMVQ